MRVIAGGLGGRRLVAPKGRTTRPTTDRVREAIFSILGGVTDARVCDLFAGSGALGIEALSRGAAHAVFVESDRAALMSLRQNLAALQLESRSAVIGIPLERAGAQLARFPPFDLVLCDPPWANLAPAVRALERVLAGRLAEDARLVLEHAAEAKPELAPELGFQLTSRRSWGDSGASFFGRKPGEGP
ncbi:MAG: 16S rRNA (guanine(966)-N(2))-methyltransferase RsmD [Polyangiaceae bacterium]